MITEETRKSIMLQAQGAMSLNIAYIGVVNGLLSSLSIADQPLGAADLSRHTGVDSGYVERWCDAAFAFGYLDRTSADEFSISELGLAFLPDQPGTMMPFAISSVLSTHMAERAAELMPGGERPGEQVLAERETLLPWFGPMLEHMFGPFLNTQILPNVPAYQNVDNRKGLVVDLGCGNGWYLRVMAKRYSGFRGIGLDGFDENIRQAEMAAQREGLADRLQFKSGNIHDFSVDEPVDMIAMNRALHHVWDDKENVFRILNQHLKAGGMAIIWEPNWPSDKSLLREPARRPMAFQNLSEHVQGNHFLRPEEITAEFDKLGMSSEIYLFGDDREAVVVGIKAQ